MRNASRVPVPTGGEVKGAGVHYATRYTSSTSTALLTNHAVLRYIVNCTATNNIPVPLCIQVHGLYTVIEWVT